MLSRRYIEIEHTADIGVEVYGETLKELFVNAAYALFNTIADAAAITPQVMRTVRVTGTDVEMLLINWLRELLYLFSVHQEVYVEFGVQDLSCPEKQDKSCTPAVLEAHIKGEVLDVDKHNFRTELKAVTYHQLSVKHEDGIWTARVIFDV